jgi:hypothetical protein
LVPTTFDIADRQTVHTKFGDASFTPLFSRPPPEAALKLRARAARLREMPTTATPAAIAAPFVRIAELLEALANRPPPSVPPSKRPASGSSPRTAEGRGAVEEQAGGGMTRPHEEIASPLVILPHV